MYVLVYRYENEIRVIRFEVLTAVRMMMLFFWVLAPCRLVGRCQRFGEHTVSIFIPEDGDNIFSPEDGDSMFLRNVGIYRRVYKAPKRREAKLELNDSHFKSHS
jgi:hypothetical protein